MKICDDVSRKQVLLEWIRALTPMDATDLTFPEDHAGRVLVHLGEAGREPISANSASDGTLRFLAMAALLMPSDAQRTYFLEELDNGLHPTRLHLLLELVRSACDRRQAQVIGTTHVPTLLAYLDEQARADALLVFRNEPGGESRVLRILEIPGAREVIESNDLGELLASGWLENAAAFASGDEGTRVAEPGP
jgi:predicted ATPase